MSRSIAAAALVAALAAPGASRAQAARAFEATGELSFHAQGTVGAGAAFDEDRVVGPNVDVARRDDGFWVGELLGLNVSLSVASDRISGPNVDLHVVKEKNEVVAIRGSFFGRRVYLEFGPKTLSGRMGACSVDLARKIPGTYAGDVGCTSTNPRDIFPLTARATLRLSGQAAEKAPPQPQFALALMAIIPG